MDNKVEEKKINCPHCNSVNCFQEDHSIENEIVESYLCMGCGYTTTSLNVTDSQFIKNFEGSSPQLFRDIRFCDPTTNLVWYPTVLNFPEYGIVFPDGTSAFDWKWRAMPIAAIPEEERNNYPIPGQDGMFYETKADMDNSKLFERNAFKDACKFLNIIQEID